MKTITAQKNFALQIILLIVLAVTISISATAGRQDRSVKNFNKIEVSGAFNVILTQGTTEKLTIEADDDMMQKIITEVKGGTLIIRLQNNTSIHNKSDLIAELTFVNLDGIDVSGAVKLNGTNAMKFSKLEIEASGATEINLDLSATHLDCDLSGASKITLQGNAPELDVDLSGASDMVAGNFRTRSCILDCSGASKSSVFATEVLKVDGSGASHVTYTGNPATVESNMSGASTLRKK